MSKVDLQNIEQRKNMSYANLFEKSVNDAALPADLVLDIASLTPEQSMAILSWVQSQADRNAAEARLRDVLREALFDVTAAELGALLHQPGAA